MPDQAMDFSRCVFAKTPLGQQEVQSRVVKLGPIPRRLLILIDGKRSTQELAAFLADKDVISVIAELLGKGCIEPTNGPLAIEPRTAQWPEPAPSPDPHPASLSPPMDSFLSQLPDVNTRTAQQVEMARNLMIHAVNTAFQPNTRLTLLEAIFFCQTAQALRDLQPRWAETIHSSAVGAQRMPEFLRQLSEVL